MKFRNLILAGLLVGLIAVAAAQNPNHIFPSAPQPNLGKLIFYGGDVNADDPNAYAFPNSNTLAVPNTRTYGCLEVPQTRTFSVTAILFNIVANVQQGQIFDPMTATYDIRRSIEPGDGGLDMRSGTASVTFTPTGRLPFGETEYAMLATLNGGIKVPYPGEWCINITPQCTDESNPLCSQVEFYVTNTTQRTNAVNPKIEPPQVIWAESPFLGYDWANWCTLGLNSEQCSYLSFGVYGY